MRITLARDDAASRLSLEEHEWRVLLKTAIYFGWTPLGTFEPDGWMRKAGSVPWDGEYVPAESQKVSEADADDIASALEHALEEVRVSEHLSGYARKIEQDHLFEVIGFLRGGTFEIRKSDGSGWWL